MANEINIKHWSSKFREAYDFQDKNESISDMIAYKICECLTMFEYDGLPETIPQMMLEMFLQTNGSAAIAKHNDELYVFCGGLGGVPDEYYRPTEYIVANPYLNLSKNYKLDEDAILMRNDFLLKGLLPIHRKYSTMLTENELSMMIADINLRIQTILLADNDSDKASGDIYIKNIIEGKIGSMMNHDFYEGIKIIPTASQGQGNQITQLIELEQYIKATWNNTLGLQSNYNMKRESINADESQLNADALIPLINHMLKCREEDVDKVNKLFGTNISVKLAEPWVSRYEAVTEEPEEEEMEVEEDDSEGNISELDDRAGDIQQSE